jgi:Protein of unknown function (DUF3667)
MDLVGGIDLDASGPLAVGQPPARRKKHHKPVEDCQNCGAKLIGEYCHVCSQHGHVHRTVAHVIEEVFHGITHFDSRTWRSLPMLAFRPGTLTREYVMGRRARYVPPFAMFLFSIFAMFLVFAFSGGPKFVSDPAASRAETIRGAQDGLRDATSEAQDAQNDVRAAEKNLAELRAATEPDQGEIGGAVGELAAAQAALANAQRDEANAKQELAKANALPAVPQAKAKAEFTPGGAVTFDSPQERDAALAELAKSRAANTESGAGLANAAIDIAENAVKNAEVKTPDNAPPQNGVSPPATVQGNTKGSIKVDIDAGGVKTKFDNGVKTGKAISEESDTDIMEMLKQAMREGTFIVTPWPELNKKIAEKTKNPDLFLYKLQSTAYKFSFLLVPLSLPFIWLMLFWKRGVTMFDHAVFALYSLSFVSFVFLMVSLLGHWFALGPLVGWACLIIPVHLFFQFKGAYQLKWFSAFWRTTLFCTLFSWIILSMFIVSVTFLGVSG